MTARHFTYLGSIEKNDLTYMQLEVICPKCRYTVKILADPDGFKKWRNGIDINKALPDLKQHERDMLELGMCKKCTNDEN